MPSRWTLQGQIRVAAALLALLVPPCASAGPPYISDDPEPTDLGHYEIYLFAMGSGGALGTELARGIDFNYGGAQDLQLTATVPLVRGVDAAGRSSDGLGNIELAAKFRFLHQADIGWDVAVFPRVFLPAAAARYGDRGTSLFLPVWVEKDWDSGWGTFGGGGCEIHHGADARDFCLAGWALTRQLSPAVQLGLELVHQGADTRDAKASTSAGVGIKVDLDANLHLLAYAGPGLQNVAPNARYDWYTSLLLTF